MLVCAAGAPARRVPWPSPTSPVDAEMLLTRSAVMTGSVGGEDGPMVGARLTLVQDGEIVDATDSDTDGAYRIADLAAGGYGLSVTAPGCEPAALRRWSGRRTRPTLRRDVDPGSPASEACAGPPRWLTASDGR